MLSGRTISLLASVLVVGVVSAGLAARCDSSEDLEELRPNDAQLIGQMRVGGGSAGGAYEARAYVSNEPFSSILEQFERYVLEHDGQVSSAGKAGKRFDLDGECLRVIAWAEDDDRESVHLFGRELAQSDVARLDAAVGSFIEEEPLDCSFRG